MTAEEVLKTKRRYAVIGASRDPEKYGYKLVRTLLDAGYAVYPVNPRYEAIDEQKCYPSLAELPEPAEVVITALAPANTERMLDQIPVRYLKFVWMPPGCGSESAAEKCGRLGVEFLDDVCPVGTLARMKVGQG